MDTLAITVRDMAGLSGVRPVTGGVPVAKGAAPGGAVFVLRDERGTAVPVQAETLARWKDGSARWVLLDFQSTPLPGEALRYELSWEPGAEPVAPESPVWHTTAERHEVESGNVSIVWRSDGALTLSDRFDVVCLLADSAGQACDAVIETAEVESGGALRTTLAFRGAFRNPQGGRVCQFRLRASVYAGLSVVRLEPLILMDPDQGVLQRIRELKFVLRPRNGAQSASIGGAPGWQGNSNTAVRLFQRDDQQYALEGTEGAGGQAPGWGVIEDGQGRVAMALRDFWQQWPKSIEASPEGLAVGLFPRFEPGAYDHMEPWYKYHYLFDGNCYQLRTGQARRWDIWVDLFGDGAALAKMANAPLIPAADPVQAIATGVWDAIAPAGTTEMAKYDSWAESLFNAYCQGIENDRDYGAMNWGDWFGERSVNWGNHEYDTVNQILIQFARTGDPKYFYAADAAARHSSEVDTVHFVNEELAAYFNTTGAPKGYPPRAGMVHEHCVGHVGSFYPVERIRDLYVEKGVGGGPNPYLCLDPFNLGHIWTQGMVRHYFLTGDPFLKETVELIGANLAQLVEDREYAFMGHSHCGRTTGWTLLALAGAYEAGLDDRYVNAMRTLTDDALAEQDPVCGGWLYSLPPGHCYCQKAKHVGMAGFITAILINGLSRYYLLSEDERLPKAIDRATTFLTNDTWREEWRDWRYTSCPASSRMGQAGVLVMAHVNSVRISDNAEHLRVLRVAWDEKFARLLDKPESAGQGKAYTAAAYGCAEAVGLLAVKGEGTRA
ncbi:MAG TPA: hypothetical protein PLM14_01270 [Candidatus Hydrogenedentes bacterium]|nr:hypothetical protein [Candidatus Hydrogenedentota bacterium]